MWAFLVKGPVRRERRGSDVVQISAGCGGSVLARSSIVGISTRLLTAAEVAAMLGVPKSWVYELSRRRLISTVSLGRYRRFREQAIAGMIEQREHRADRLAG
jgi:excisionase family DNA binding protein